MNEKLILQLMFAKGIGDVALKKILSYFSHNDSVYYADVFASAENIEKHLGISRDISTSIISEQNIELTETTYYKLKTKDIKIISEYDERYPEMLRASLGDKCPPVLFVEGNENLLNTDAVGFCGSRKVSPKGLEVTRECSKQLAEKKVTVVSGYAAGTDLTAHNAALQYGGNTIFVLAEGILRKAIKNEIRNELGDNNYLFVSQFPPNLTWNAGNAMKRNGTIIGLSKLMILVESGVSGGTFAAGEETLKARRPLFVIDFAKPEVSAEANPYFISKGGIPIRGKNGIPNMSNVFMSIDNYITNNRNDSVEQLKIAF